MRDTKYEILHFWFEEVQPQQWFQSNPELDSLITEKFLSTYEMAKDGLCDNWAVDEEGALALCILLDQFPRHMFRGKAEMFGTDRKALLVVKEAINKGFDQILEPVKRGFLYVPFQHSEELNDQNRSVELMKAMGDDNPAGYDYAKRHRDVIEKFGRFPHRNEVLGRVSTTEELDHLEQNPSGF
ncbi:MAG: membrane protein [Micavibrio sp.]|nr:MAG: membrane protein [Micavibrio sp.]